MATLPAATSYTGSSVTQGDKKTFMASLRAFIAAALGTDTASLTFGGKVNPVDTAVGGSVLHTEGAGTGFSMIDDKYTGAESSTVLGVHYSNLSSVFASGVRPRGGATGYVSSHGQFSASRWAFEMGGAANTQAALLFAGATTTSAGTVISMSTAWAVDVNGHFLPGADNARNLGSASLGWKELFCDNGTINTSDARWKTTVRPLEDREIAAAAHLAREIGAFRFLAAVEAKGDAARLHVGMTVQRAVEIMREHDLDPMNYSFICHDQWGDEFREIPAVEAQPAVEAAPAEYRSEEFDEDAVVDGKVIKLRRTRLVETRAAIAAREAVAGSPATRELVRAAGDKYSFRVHELLLFIARGFEARLAALEAK